MPEPVHDIAQVHFVWLRSYLSDNLSPYSHILLDMPRSPGCCSHSIYSDQGIVTASCCKSCAGPCLSFPIVFWRRLPRMPRKSLAGAFRRGHKAWSVVNCKTFLQGRLLAKLPQNERLRLDNESHCTRIIHKLLVPRFGFGNISGRLQLPTAWLVFWWDAYIWPREWMGQVCIGRTSSKMKLGLSIDALWSPASNILIADPAEMVLLDEAEPLSYDFTRLLLNSVRAAV